MGAQATPFYGGSYAQDPALQAYAKMDPVYGQFLSSGAADAGFSYPQWQFMGTSTGSKTPAQVPTVNPWYMQANSGPMLQNGANWNQVYGQMQVPTPYLNMLNNRFGWNNRRSFGAAMPFDTSRPQYYQPQQMYPQTSFPSLMR